MTDELLPYYDRELSFLRKMGERFARDHPRIAGRLKLGPEGVEDPHVERLIESVAFLNARLQHRLDDDFPELSDSLLSVLYPHYLAPIPSMSTVQFTADPDATASYTVGRGEELETERADGEPCSYRTCYETEVWPLRVTGAKLKATPFQAPAIPAARRAVACLRLTIEPTGAASLATLEPSRLRFHLRGLPQHVYPLYEVLLNDVIGVALGKSPGDSKALELPPDVLSPVGFEADEGLLPYGERSLTGYRLLTEFFAFPQKFLYVDLAGLDEMPSLPDRHLEVFLYLRRLPRDLDQFVDADAFALGCTPIVNLFQRRAEPIRFEHLEHESRVVPDTRRPLAMEVYSIDALTMVDADGETRALRPFYGIDHGPHAGSLPIFWHAARRPASLTSSRVDRGSEVFLQVIDLEFEPAQLESKVLTAEITCTNRDLPASLPFGSGRPRMTLTAGGAVKEIRCLSSPTRTRRPSLRQGARWRLISHLSLNHLSLSDDGGVEALREILRLYELVGSSENLGLIEGIESIGCTPGMARITAGGQPGYCRGVNVSLTLDEAKFTGSGYFLFASVLERFLGLYASANSFVRLTLLTHLRESAVKKWPPRAGDRALI